MRREIVDLLQRDLGVEAKVSWSGGFSRSAVGSCKLCVSSDAYGWPAKASSPTRLTG